MRDYRNELDGFTVGEVVALKEEPYSRWKILKMWVDTRYGRAVHLAELVCTDPGQLVPRYNRRVGTRKEGTNTSWLMKAPAEKKEPMGVVNRDERLFSLGMKLRQVARVQFGRIFGTEPNTSGRYKAMMDLLERCYFMRAEINAFTKLMIDKGVFTQSELQKALDDEMSMYFKEVAAQWPEIEFHDDGFTIKKPQELAERMRNENWPP